MSSEDFLREMRPFVDVDTRGIEIAPGADVSFVAAFVARQRESVGSLEVRRAGLVVVLEGTKQLHRGAVRFEMRPGEAFVMPVGAKVDIVNSPDAASGFYRALCFNFAAEVVAEARRQWPDLVGARWRSDPKVVLTVGLASAVLHAAEALSGAIAVSQRVADARVMEVLLHLAEQGHLPLEPHRFVQSVAEAVTLTIRNAPDHPWTASRIATTLGLAEPTLRRKLAREGTCFRDLLAEERMRAAHALLSSGGTVIEALEAAGYSSRSHFAAKFRATFGTMPSET